MKVRCIPISLLELESVLKTWLGAQERRLGLITSIDGGQLATLVLDTSDGSGQLWLSKLHGDHYPCLTSTIAQCHWFERDIRDLFGITPVGHPRLKPIFMHAEYDSELTPLRRIPKSPTAPRRSDADYAFLPVKGEGIYELPVGPVHAGIIEPGHFRLTCMGEIVVNLEVRLGYLHRGVEKRLTEVPWRKGRFVAEAAASDTAAGNALAHGIAIESLFGLEVPLRAQQLRTLAMEIERIAMHVGDIGGMAVDIGFAGIAVTLSRLRGQALKMAELLSGSRYLRGFILPGGVRFDPDKQLVGIENTLARLKKEIRPVLEMFFEDPVVFDRLLKVGRLSHSLAVDFGTVGVAARASGIAYDARRCFAHGVYPELAPPVMSESAGDVMARLRVRMAELYTSFNVMEKILQAKSSGAVAIDLPDSLPKDAIGVAVVEAFRGELIHLVMTDDDGAIKRYAIKDPSVNNWTAVAIAVRNNLVADFPICNKSFSLSYSGDDL